MSFFTLTPRLPDDPILSITEAFDKDLRRQKVNLGVGSYKTAEGLPMVLPSVIKAESLITSKHLDKEYLPIDGLPSFIKDSLDLIFGKDSQVIKENRVYGAQAIGGSGAIRLAAELIKEQLGEVPLFLPDPTWPNHKLLFTRGGVAIDTYSYYDPIHHGLDFKGMCRSIKRMKKGSVILLHCCCHNPTGMDPTLEQWQELSSLIKAQEIIPLFDTAYHGFDQDLEADIAPIRLFVEDGHELFVTYSFSKNMGLYGERVGLFAFLANSEEKAANVGSHIRKYIRGLYSNPPSHGARIVSTILESTELRADWHRDLKIMRDRISEMRKALVALLIAKKTTRNFTFLGQQKGIFSFCGLDADQVHRLKVENGIYMPSNGRVNVAGLNSHNLDYVVDSLISVLAS